MDNIFGDEHKMNEKVVTIKLRPWKLFKAAIIFIVLLGVFILGRWSVDPPEINIPSINLLGLFTADKNAAEKAVETAPAPKVTTPAEETTVAETPVRNTSVVETAAETPAASNESIITKYTKVTIELIDTAIEWKETWGKVIRIGYRINNLEAGTIKPENLVMMMEGYEDMEKSIPLPASAKNIKAGTAVGFTSTIPNGFAYSPKTVGDLKKVRIMIYLKNAEGVAIASAAKDMDLSAK